MSRTEEIAERVARSRPVVAMVAEADLAARLKEPPDLRVVEPLADDQPITAELRNRVLVFG